MEENQFNFLSNHFIIIPKKYIQEDPHFKKFKEEEDLFFENRVSIIGKKWKAISILLDRSPVEIKNRYQMVSLNNVQKYRFFSFENFSI